MSKSRPESTLALRRLFQLIETRFGGLPFDQGPAAEILTRHRHLDRHDLERLTRHEATAVHVKGFYPPSAARKLGQELAKQATTRGKNWKISTSRGLESSDVFTLGEHPPFNVVAAAEDKKKAQNDYFDGVIRELHGRREMGESDDDDSMRLWPLDKLRLELDEQWPSGAGLAREEGGSKRPFSGGLPRVMTGPTRWRKGLIHVDEMGPLDSQKGLFSANIYLQLPQQSTANPDSDIVEAEPILHIWPVGIRSRWDWYRNALLLSGLSSQDPEDQIRLRTLLGEPQTISVEPGDLILLCAQRPNEALGFAEGVRVSLQCFIQHQGSENRLLVDA